jgi:hypothetical protein
MGTSSPLVRDRIVKAKWNCRTFDRHATSVNVELFNSPAALSPFQSWPGYTNQRLWI